jgi:hypothetical protein
MPWDPMQPKQSNRYELIIDGTSMATNCSQGFRRSFPLSSSTQHTVELKSTGVSGFLKSIVGSSIKQSVCVTVHPDETKEYVIGYHYQRCGHHNQKNMLYFEEKR